MFPRGKFLGWQKKNCGRNPGTIRAPAANPRCLLWKAAFCSPRAVGEMENQTPRCQNFPLLPLPPPPEWAVEEVELLVSVSIFRRVTSRRR